MSSGDPRLRFRFFAAGVLIDETWIDAGHSGAQARVDQIQAHHLLLSRAAADRGLRWLVEIYDPERPEGHDHVRFGTDAGGMGRPIVTLDLAGDVLGQPHDEGDASPDGGD